MLLFLYLAISQPGKKPTQQKEKPSAKKEIEYLKKEAQKTVNGLSPEDKKTMDSLGIKMPSFKNVPKVTDKQLADATEEEERTVSKKDIA